MEAQAGDGLIDESTPPITRLQQAAINGDVPSLLNLLSEHPGILDLERCFFKQSSLHVALKLGQLEFAKQILDEKPELAEDLDDVQRSSALHISAEKGQFEMVTMLLSMSPGMCLACNRDGRNPVHLAAIRGHKDVLGVLLQAMPQAARERTLYKGGDTVLHLCVKYCQLEILTFFIEKMDAAHLLNSRDNDGNTVLHLAVSAKQPPMVDFLVNKWEMEKNATNTNGKTAMDICMQSNTKDDNQREILQSLNSVKALRANDVLNGKNNAWSEKQRKVLMVVASLIAGMAFQFGINPPGGAWQDDNDGHIAGQSILAHKHSNAYNVLLASNTIGFVSSLNVIYFVMCGEQLSVAILKFTMWIALVATSFSYGASVTFLSPHIRFTILAIGIMFAVLGFAMPFTRYFSFFAK